MRHMVLQEALCQDKPPTSEREPLCGQSEGYVKLGTVWMSSAGVGPCRLVSFLWFAVNRLLLDQLRLLVSCACWTHSIDQQADFQVYDSDCFR